MTVDEAIEIKWQGLQRGDHAPEALRASCRCTRAYQVQLGVLERYKANGETQAGWKIGLTADAIRQIYSIPATRPSASCWKATPTPAATASTTPTSSTRPSNPSFASPSAKRCAAPA